MASFINAHCFSHKKPVRLSSSMESYLIATPSYEQSITGEVMHPLITFIASTMVSNTVDGL